MHFEAITAQNEENGLYLKFNFQDVSKYFGGLPSTLTKNQNFKKPKNRTCLIWRHIFPDYMMPDSQFDILVTSGHLFKTVLQLWTHMP